MRRAEHEGQASQVPRGVGASGDRVVATPVLGGRWGLLQVTLATWYPRERAQHPHHHASRTAACAADCPRAHEAAALPGGRLRVTGQHGRPRSARHRGRARRCPKTTGFVPHRGAWRRASATAQNGASWASPPLEARACCQPERVASITNPSVFPGARARTCACAALGWAHAPVSGRARQASSLSHSVPAHDPRCIPATPTELGTPWRARARRPARHALESARRIDRARPRTARRPRRAGPGRVGAAARGRAPSRARSHELLATGTGSKDSRLYSLWNQTQIWDPGD